MPIKSMTGFGRGESEEDGVRIEVEAGSVNRKQFDARFNLPRDMQSLESRLAALARKHLSRGQLSVMVRVGAGKAHGQSPELIDGALAAERIAELRRIARQLSLPDDLSAMTLVALRDTLRIDMQTFDPDRLASRIEKVFARALVALVAMRDAEGRALEKTLASHLRELQGVVVKIKTRAPRVTERYRRALRDRLVKAGIHCAPMDPVLAREVAVFADRADITEELDRLESHFKQWQTLASSKASNGRALDFLCQEIFREINTIGAKANDAFVTRQVIRSKTILERMREQVQNVE